MNSNGSVPFSRLQQRTAFTLIEMLVIMPAMSALILLSIAWAHKAMQYTSAAKADRQYHQQMTRLTWDFRDDVNACQRIELGDGVLNVEFSDGHATKYEVAENEILSTTSKDGKQVSSERYTLHRDATISFNKSEDEKWVTLYIHSEIKRTNGSSKSSESTPVNSEEKLELKVECKVNRWEVGK